MVCLQETKCVVLNDFNVIQLLDSGFDYFCLSSTSMSTYSASARMRHQVDGKELWLAVVYGPSRDSYKPAFLDELQELAPFRSGPWLLTGDLNLIYCAAHKNNDNLNRRLMGQFRRLLNDTCLREPFEWKIVHLE
jgi:hypothetical protein